MIVIYDKARHVTFLHALAAGDYVVSHRMSIANHFAVQFGYLIPIHLIGEEESC